MSAPAEERWKVLARQAANENDPVRLVQLVKELLEETDHAAGKKPAQKAKTTTSLINCVYLRNPRPNDVSIFGKQLRGLTLKVIPLIADAKGVGAQITINKRPQTDF